MSEELKAFLSELQIGVKEGPRVLFEPLVEIYQWAGRFFSKDAAKHAQESHPPAVSRK